MSSITTLINCPEIQAELNGHFGEDPTLTVEPLVLTEFLLSDFNTAATEQQSLKEKVSPGGGKSRIVELIYSPRLSESDVSDSEGNESCTADDPPGDVSQQYDVGDRYLQVSVAINPRDLRYRCEENTTFAAKKIAQKLSQLERALETEYFTALSLLYGNFAAEETGVVSKTKQVATRDSSGKFSTDAMVQVPQSTAWANYPGPPILFGGRQWGEYMQEVNAGCCAIDGINVADLAAQNQMALLKSYRADTIFGEGAAISVAPRAAQLLEWMEYEGMAFIDLGTVQQMTITSPRTGQRFDMKINVDCNGIFNFFIRKYFKLVSMPNDVYFPDDRLAGVVNINRFEIVNP